MLFVGVVAFDVSHFCCLHVLSVTRISDNRSAASALPDVAVHMYTAIFAVYVGVIDDLLRLGIAVLLTWPLLLLLLLLLF